MWNRDQIPGSQLPTGTVIIDPPELHSTRKRMVAVYARVSRVAIITSSRARRYGRRRAKCKT